MNPSTSCLCALFFFCPLAWATQVCERLPVLAPARFETLAERQPTLRWVGDPNQRYRVQVAALLPEARVVTVHDLEVTGNQLRLPERLPVERASVKVLVSRHCPGLDTQDLFAQGPWFFVDTRPACAIDPQSFQGSTTGLRWAPVPGAQRYSVRAFDLADFMTGESLVPRAETEIQAPFWPFNLHAAGRPEVFAVQASCGDSWGKAVAWPVPQRNAVP